MNFLVLTTVFSILGAGRFQSAKFDSVLLSSDSVAAKAIDQISGADSITIGLIDSRCQNYDSTRRSYSCTIPDRTNPDMKPVCAYVRVYCDSLRILKNWKVSNAWTIKKQREIIIVRDLIANSIPAPLPDKYGYMVIGCNSWKSIIIAHYGQRAMYFSYEENNSIIYPEGQDSGSYGYMRLRHDFWDVFSRKMRFAKKKSSGCAE